MVHTREHAPCTTVLQMSSLGDERPATPAAGHTVTNDKDV